MKVAFIEQEAQLGGVEYTTLRVVEAFDKSRIEPIIVCPEDGELPRLARQAGLNVHLVSRPKFISVSFFLKERYFANPFGIASTTVNIFRAAFTLHQYLQANPVDIVITKGLLAHFYGGLAATKLNIPCIWYVQEEVDAKRAGGIFQLILKIGARNLPSKIVVDAEALLEQFGDMDRINNKVQVIYNGIDTNQFRSFSRSEYFDARKIFGIPENALVIGQVGRLVPLKGQKVLLGSFVNLSKYFPNTHLLFVGAPLFGNRDYELELRNYVTQQGLDEKVHFTGFIPDVRQGLAAMDIVVHASVETDSPVSVMEAMACSLPVVVSGVQGTLELVMSESDAIVFPPGDSNVLSIALSRLIESENLRVGMGIRARETIIQKFSLQLSVTRLETLIKEVYAA